MELYCSTLRGRKLPALSYVTFSWLLSVMLVSQLTRSTLPVVVVLILLLVVVVVLIVVVVVLSVIVLVVVLSVIVLVVVLSVIVLVVLSFIKLLLYNRAYYICITISILCLVR